MSITSYSYGVRSETFNLVINIRGVSHKVRIGGLLLAYSISGRVFGVMSREPKSR